MKKASTILAALLLLTSPLLNAQTAEDNAAKIVAATNHVVDLYNSYLPYLKKVSEGLKLTEQSYASQPEDIAKAAYLWDCDYIVLRSDYREDFEKAIAATPSFPEKTSIQAGVRYIRNNTERLSKGCSELRDYFVGKDYKLDADLKRFDELFKNMEAAYVDISDTWYRTITLSAEASDRSELVLLKKSPIAELIIPMKADLSLAAKILGWFSEDEIDLAALKAEIEMLRQNVAKNKVLTEKNVEVLEKYSSKTTYDGYYLMMDELVELATQLDSLINPANTMGEEERNRLIENTYSMISYKYNSLVESYNAM